MQNAFEIELMEKKYGHEEDYVRVFKTDEERVVKFFTLCKSLSFSCVDCSSVVRRLWQVKFRYF